MLEVPVGFKWFVDGLIDGTLGFVGEESAGATFLRRNGSVWTTDKDGLILGLLSAEMTADTGKDPGQLYNELTAKYGDPVYQRIDAAATPEQKAKLAKLSRRAGHRQRRWPANPSPPSSPKPPATTPPSAASRSPPKTAGSPPAPPAPKTSTKSTPKASTAKPT